MQFAYKAVSAHNAELRIYVIPVNEQLVERTGSPRATYVVPKEHIGDGNWHVARIAYDYTSNPAVKFVHFAARIVGTAGEILLDDFAYLEEAGPILAFGEPTLDEDPEQPGSVGVLRVQVNNVGDRSAERVRVSVQVPAGLSVEPRVHEIPVLPVKRPQALRWKILGQRRGRGSVHIRAAADRHQVEATFPLRPQLRVRSGGPAQPVTIAGGDFTLECQLENTGSALLENIEVLFRAGATIQKQVLSELPPSKRSTVQAKFKAPSVLGVLPVQIEISAVDQAQPTGLESRIRVVPAVELPAPADRPNADASGAWAVVENNRVRVLFLREPAGFGAGVIQVKNSKGQWVQAAWIPVLARLVVKPPEAAEASAAWEGELTGNLAPRTQVAPGYASLELPGRIETGPARGLEYVVRFQIPAEENLIGWEIQAITPQPVRLVAFDSPLVYVVDRQEAIFPGLEWLVEDELSSDSLDIAEDHPDRIRYVPHPQKITVPAVTFTGSYGTLAYVWDVHQKWDGQRDRPPCVFASPDRFNNQRGHLVGLILPGVPEFIQENQRIASTPYLWQGGQKLRLTGWIWADGSASDPLAGIEAYLRLVGLPPMRPLPRGSYEAEVAFSMQAYLQSLWDEKEQKWWTSKGGGILSRLDRPANYAADLLLAEWVVEEPGLRSLCRARAELVAAMLRLPARWDALAFPGRFDLALAGSFGPSGLLAERNPDGSWGFDADQPGSGPFEGMDYRQLGPHGAVEVGTCARRAYTVLRYARIAGDWDAYHQMLPTLELMENFRVPRAAQVWEIPVHTPDVLAAADAVDAFIEAYRLSGEERWLADSVQWAKRGLPFIYLWDDPDKPYLQGASIPVFGATWYRGSWFGRAVQWNGLRYAEALLRLADYDASLPWREIAERIVRSALYQQDTQGENVALWPDAISLIDGSKASWVFAPRQILDLVLHFLGRNVEPRTVAIGRPPEELRITSLASLSDVNWGGGRLVMRVQFRPREEGCILVSNIGQPTDVLVDGQPIPEDPRVEQSATAAWRYDSGLAYLVIRIPTERPVQVEVVPAEFLKRERIALPVEEIAFEFDKSFEGWLAAHDVTAFSVADGFLVGTVTGRDPYIVRSNLRIAPDRYKVLRIRMRSTAGSVAQLFWTTAESPQFDEEKSLLFRLGPPGEFGEYELNVGEHPRWRGQRITALRLDPGGSVASGEFAVDYIRGQ
ncbi:MAG: hypothetical protein NZ899_08535 [Thermoguttaceae bacterium]|nr:hypothetical protein [Thermoguttaceae bacterium]MDW8078336.1 hypothetical protein [Thermoguttaceae bacterium]